MFFFSTLSFSHFVGSTGSIGTQTLDICRERPLQFQCVAMAAGDNLDLLSQQIMEFKPKLVSIRSSKLIDTLRNKLKSLGTFGSHLEESVISVRLSYLDLFGLL